MRNEFETGLGHIFLTSRTTLMIFISMNNILKNVQPMRDFCLLFLDATSFFPDLFIKYLFFPRHNTRRERKNDFFNVSHKTPPEKSKQSAFQDVIKYKSCIRTKTRILMYPGGCRPTRFSYSTKVLWWNMFKTWSKHYFFFFTRYFIYNGAWEMYFMCKSMTTNATETNSSLGYASIMICLSKWN